MRVLTAAAAKASENEITAAALRELRGVQNNTLLAWIAKHMPIKEDLE
jgi:hypothetical protein